MPVKHSFTIDEDLRILKLVEDVGPKFDLFARNFPGKSINNIKNRYYKVIRYRKEELLKMYNKYLKIVK